ncbi:hypothetical protein EC973_003090 [Apophysomyces ossiformis]|uniref:Ricin B lectin domain-containing protein n=1 Tax=Apophysomyces ossiformis TaxID=679940 RepID=A0A8H7BRM6_9FUNG|nr:hypothetical protein EC973_003090 [Apophysomyces ossiformis]
MARPTALSTLLALVVLLQTIVVSVIATEYRIVNGGGLGWLKNFPKGHGRPPFATPVAVDSNYASIYERWTIDHADEGYIIRNVGTGYTLWAKGEEVEASSEDAQKFYIESHGSGKFTISIPNEDKLVAPGKLGPEYPYTLFLQPANGSPAQTWSFERIN